MLTKILQGRIKVFVTLELTYDTRNTYGPNFLVQINDCTVPFLSYTSQFGGPSKMHPETDDG